MIGASKRRLWSGDELVLAINLYCKTPFGRIHVHHPDIIELGHERPLPKIHPRGNKKNPLSGGFAIHSPVRSSLIGVSRCKIIFVKDNIIEVENIDAFSRITCD